MTDTTISNAVVFPQDDGTGVPSGQESYDSAGYFALLAKYKGDGSYVGEDDTGAATLQFANVDTTNEEVDVDPGYAYIMESGHTVQSGAQTSYDTTLPEAVPYVVALPTTVTNLGLGTDTSNDLWLAVDPTGNDSVYIRHGSGLSAPSDPSVKLGTVDTSDGSTTRANDLSAVSVNTIDVDTAIQDTGTDAVQFDGSQNVIVPNGATEALGTDSDSVNLIINDNWEALDGTYGEYGYVFTNSGDGPSVISEAWNDWSLHQFYRYEDDGGGSKTGVPTDAFLGVIRSVGTDSDGNLAAAGRLQFKSGDTVGSGVISGKMTVELSDSGGSSVDVLTLLGDDQSASLPNGDLKSGDTNGALELDERTNVADTGKVALSRDASVHGYAMIQDVTNDTACMVYLGGAANTVEIIHDSGSSNNYTTTEDNDGTTNIYWDSTNAQYELNNETGGTATYAVEVLKA